MSLMRRALSLPTLLALPLALAAQKPTSLHSALAVTKEEAFVAWASETAIPMGLEQPVPVEVLRPMVADKRFVFLGEPDHYIHEKYPFRLRFLEALHTLGWRHLGMEMGRSDGIRFDEYLAGDDETRLLDVGLYSNVRNIPRTVENGGFLAMEFQYARYLRKLVPTAERYHYFGFDLDMRPGNGIQDAFLRAERAGAQDLSALLREIWKGEDSILDLEGLIEELQDPDSAFVEDLSADVRARVLLDLTTLSASRRFSLNDAFAEDEPANLMDAFARREETMFVLFDAYVAELGEEGRIALTGHNMHLGRDWRNTTWKELETDLPITLWPTIGAHVTRHHERDVFAIWLVYDHGVHATAGTQQPVEVHSVPGTLENLLARLSLDTFLLPLHSEDPRSDWLDEKRTFRVNGGVAHGRLRELTDAVFFVREAHPPGNDI